MARWTEAQVVKLAPDDASVRAARSLTRPGSWSETGSTDLLVWGKCQGSGKTPYQVSVDLTGPAFRCTCPSRKFPCKHALALLLLWTASGGSVADAGKPAGFAQEWADQRSERARPRRAEAAAPPDPAAQARRLEQRTALMDAGIDDFALWLADLVRGGLAAARQQPYAWWDETAARLVDAQLPGLAEQVRTMASDVHRRTDWADHLLASAGRWWTATRAWSQREALSPEEAGDLRVLVGWSVASAEVRAADSRSARFLVLGGHRSDDGRLQQQRTWLRDEETGELLQVLDFAAAGAVLAVPQLAGTVLETTVARYTGTAPRRALFAEDPTAVGRAVAFPGDGVTVDGALSARADRLAVQPWNDRLPVVLRGVTVAGDQPEHVRDAEGDRLDLVPEAATWLLLALTGGHPADVFGGFVAGRFRPLTLAGADGLVAL